MCFENSKTPKHVDRSALLDWFLDDVEAPCPIARLETPKTFKADEPVTAPIKLENNGTVVSIDIPMDLMCALFLIKVSDVYTIDDLTAAQSALTTFSQINDDSPSSHKTDESTVMSSDCGLLDSPTTGGLLPVPARLDVYLMSIDESGSVLVQQMMAEATELQLDMMVNDLVRIAVVLSQNTHGCRVIQKAFDICSVDQKVRIVNSLEDHYLECIVDVNANHVMQKMFESVPSVHLTSVCSVIAENIKSLSLHCYGCRVVQKLLQKCEMSNKQIVLDLICANDDTIILFAKDQFANYVLQHTLEFGTRRHKRTIAAALVNCAQILCRNKFASNVFERLFKVCESEIVESTAIALEPIALELMMDKFGNYVIKSAIKHSRVIQNIASQNSSRLRKHTYGWHLV